MLYALTHPGRTVRWWRYRLAYALAERRRALATLRSEQRARRALAETSDEAAKPRPERGEVIGRSFIGRDGEVRDLTSEEHRGDWFERRSALALDGSESRDAWR